MFLESLLCASEVFFAWIAEDYVEWKPIPGMKAPHNDNDDKEEEEESEEEDDDESDSSDSDREQGDVNDEDDEAAFTGSDDTMHSMLNSYGQMTVNSHDDMARDFYGAASGLAFIQRTSDILQNPRSSSPYSTDISNELSNSATVQLFDAPLPPKQAHHTNTPVSQLLPSRPVADRLVHLVFTQVYPMFHFLCSEDFDQSANRVYGKSPQEYDEVDYGFLPLFYLVMGLGYLFSREEHDKYGCRNAMAQG